MKPGPVRSLTLICASSLLTACVSIDGDPERPTTTIAPTTSTTTIESSTTTIRPSDEDTSSPSTSISLLSTYQIFDLEDVSFGNTVRYVAHVAVEGTPDIDQLAELAVLIEETIRAEHLYQALSVGFYDYPDYFGFGFVMGRVEFAPFGDWGRADEVELGDYSSFEAKSFLREKDWRQQPTQMEVTIWRKWEDVIIELDPDLTRDDVLELEAEGYQLVADAFGLSVAEAEEAVERAALWPFS